MYVQHSSKTVLHYSVSWYWTQCICSRQSLLNPVCFELHPLMLSRMTLSRFGPPLLPHTSSNVMGHILMPGMTSSRSGSSLKNVIARIEDGISKIQELRPTDAKNPYFALSLMLLQWWTWIDRSIHACGRQEKEQWKVWMCYSLSFPHCLSCIQHFSHMAVIAESWCSSGNRRYFH